MKCQRKTSTIGYHLCVESNKIKQTSEYNKAETDRYREQMRGYLQGEGKGKSLRGTNYYV